MPEQAHTASNLEVIHDWMPFDVFYKADAPKGQRRRIEASSNSGGTYEETTQKVVLSGGAVADMTMVPPDERVQAVHFKGEQITADLKTKQIKVSQAHMEVTGDVEQ